MVVLHHIARVVLPLVIASAAVAQSERFVAPEWRGDAGGYYAGWDDFTAATGLNAPDSAGSAAGFALYQDEPTAFVTSSGNLYSFAQPLVIRIETPELVAAPAQVVLQVRVLATPVDTQTLRLERWSETVGWEVLAAPQAELLQSGETGSPGFGVATDETWRWTWTPSAGPGGRYRIVFRAVASSQSLAAVALDLAPPSALVDAYQAWLGLYFSDAELSVAEVSGPEADPDGDGLVNLLEYALGGDPRSAHSAPRAELVAGGPGAPLGLRFSRVEDPALVYRVEASSDLSLWTPVWSSTGSDNLVGEVVATDTVAPGPAQTRRFLRLNVERQP